MTIDEQIDLIQEMNRQAGKLIVVEIRARQAGEDDLAARVAERYKTLQLVIDELRGRAAESWGDTADDLRDEIRRINAQVQRRIRNIRDSLDVADDVLKVIEAVDQVVGLLAGFGVAIPGEP